MHSMSKTVKALLTACALAAAAGAATAQEQVVQSLIQFNHAQMPMSKERLNVLMHLDEHARDMQFSLCSQYLRNPRPLVG